MRGSRDVNWKTMLLHQRLRCETDLMSHFAFYVQTWLMSKTWPTCIARIKEQAASSDVKPHRYWLFFPTGTFQLPFLIPISTPPPQHKPPLCVEKVAQQIGFITSSLLQNLSSNRSLCCLLSALPPPQPSKSWFPPPTPTLIPSPLSTRPVPLLPARDRRPNRI